MANSITLGLVQQSCTADVEQNLAASIEGIQTLAQHKSDVVVLPELHRTLYFCQTEDVANFDLAETIPGPTTDKLAQVAKTHSLIIIASIFERRAKGIYHNTAVVIERDGTIAGTYRKMHIPDDPGFYEKFYFTPGDLGFQPVQTSAGKIGVLVCWDQWYPEAARLMALAGADLLVIPTAIGWDTRDSDAEQQRQRDAWTTIQRAHAIANGLPLVSCNRTGHEADPSGQTAGIQFWGSSFIAGPQGEILAHCGTDNTQVLAVDINLDRSEHIRRIWPYFRDRRIDAYSDIVRRYRD
ncbi:MAG: carbon-nitrogen hydrolase [Gammaproteobacteria bacterium]|jgi:N-carbamoylputrescine amidase